MMKTLTIEWMKTVTCLAIVLAMLPSASYAVDKIWTGASGTSWGTSGNWNPSGAPGTGDTVIFDGTGANYSSVNLNSARTVRSMSITTGQTVAVTMNASTNATLTFRYPGNVLTVAAGNHKIVGTGTGTSLLDCDVSFSNGTNTYDIASGASFEIQGRIGNGDTDNIHNKIGGGTLILSGQSGGSKAWIFAVGGFHVQNGALRLAGANAAGNSGNNFFVSSGATLEVSGDLTFMVGGGNWTLNGTGISSNGALRSVSGTNTLTTTSTGTLTLASPSSIGVDSGTLIVKRLISGTNVLAKVGAGTLLLSTNNTYSGAAMIVEAGKLAFGTTNALSASTPVALSGGTIAVGTYSNALSTLTLAGDATIDLGDGTGTLSFADSSALSSSWNGTLSLTGTLGDKTLRFGTDANGLTPEQQAKIRWNGYSTKLNSQGYVIILRGTIFMIF